MPVKGQSKKHNEENLPALPQEQFLFGKERGPTLNQGNIRSPNMKYRRKLFIFFVMEIKCIEKMMELQLWSIKENLQKHFPHCPHWSDYKWKKSMAGGGGNKKNTNTVLILQDKSYLSELFKVFQDAILLILLYRTMLSFRATLPVHLSCRD